MANLADRIQQQMERHLRPDKGTFPLSELAKWCAKEYGDLPALRIWTGEEYREVTYTGLWSQVQAIAHWLIEQGFKQGDRAAVLGENRPEWAASYLAIVAAGGVVVPVDRLLPVSGVRHIISDSGSTFLFASCKTLDVVAEMEDIKTLKTIVCFDDEGVKRDDDILALSGVLEEGRELDQELPTRSLDDWAAILYTSGTTGHSKGVILSQGNIMSNVAASYRSLPLGPGDTFLSVLPVHHSYEGTAGFLFPLYAGCSITYARSMKSQDLLTDMKETDVTIMLGVPLLYEKFHAGIKRGIKKKGAVAWGLFSTLYNLSALGEKFGKRWGVGLFRSFRKKAGLGTVNYFISGGGPLDPQDSLFFNRFGIYMLQGFGLTETSPITHLTPPWRIRHECIGPPFPGVQHKLINPNAEGIGELCIKGPNVFVGYYKNDDATAEAIDEENWLHTGDLAMIHDDGYVQITGRKKNMLVTGGGKNVYPEEIEYLISSSDFIAEVLVLGVPRQSGLGDEVGALVFPDYEQLDLHFEKQGKKASEDDVFALIRSEIKRLQAPLAEYKSVRHLRIMQEEFQKTSTRKIKRYLYSGDMLRVNGGE